MSNFKPNYAFIYKNKKSLDLLLSLTPFNEKYVQLDRDDESYNIEFENFSLRCFQMDKPRPSVLGYRTMSVIIEEELMLMMDENFISDVVSPMTDIYFMFGGDIVVLGKDSIYSDKMFMKLP